MRRALPALTLLTALGATSPAGATRPPEDPFPASTALEQGVSPAALADLEQRVRSFVDDGEVVGAELLVIKKGRTILHGAWGLGDREAGRAMQTGSVFCVRSMTKPVIGAAILMLVDEDVIDLDDPVARFLPSFDVDGSRDITVEHLLTHTSGLPMSLILGRNLAELHATGGIRAVADLGAGHELGFAPGSAFQYSDQGTDTLTALVEAASGTPAAEFVRERVLAPLGMEDSACVLAEDHPLRARALAKYAGSRGAWSRFWGPDEPPLFPFFLGSQGLYATLEDYARFLQLWLRKGRVGREKLLGARFVRRALTPGPHPTGAPTGFPDLRVDYGYLMQLWTRPGEDEGEEENARGEREVVAFGHTGSDGTHAWVFPEQDAMVLYFTQSRGNATGLRVEEALARLFLGAPFDPNEVAPPVEPYLGFYWEGEGDLYRAIVRDGDDLALEILGQGVVPLDYAGGDRWKFRPNPSVVLAFDRSDTGEVTGYHIGDHRELRFEPSSDLPGIDELAARVADTHRIALVESLGPLRLQGELDMEKLDIAGEVRTLLAWPDRYRIDTTAGDTFESLVHDGETVRYSTSSAPATTLEGLRAEQARRASPLVRLGDWRRGYPTPRVIQRLEKAGEGSDGTEEIFVVRMGDTSAPRTTLYVHSSGLVFREDSLTHIDNVGRIGQRIDFMDFRDVSGMLLPHRIELHLAHPLIGTIVTTVSGVELGVDLDGNAFSLEE